MQMAGAERQEAGGDGSNTPPRVINFEQSLIRRFVREYLACDYSVIPIKPGTKQPYVAWKEFQERRPTKDEWDGWLRDFPDAQIAVVTGWISKLMVIDFDKEGAIARFEQRFGRLPATIRQETNRGIHYLYFCPKGLPSRASILDGVDVKAEGGLVMMSPSIHPSGKRYWFKNSFEYLYIPNLPNPPDKLIEYLRAPWSQADKRDPVTFAPVPKGQRNSKITSIAGRYFGKGWPLAEVLLLCSGYNQTLDEPLPQARLRPRSTLSRKPISEITLTGLPRKSSTKDTLLLNY